VYAYPGDGINGLVAVFGRADDKPQFIQTRHEEMAAFTATGYAKFSGRVGVCMATSDPGAIHLLNGLYDAKLDHMPVVAIVGQTARSAVGGAYQQEVDLKSLYKDVASDYLVEVNVAAQLPSALDRAIRTAMTRRAPTAIIIPSDVQEEPYEAPGNEFKQVPSSEPNDSAPVLKADETAVRGAADIINAGEKVAILIGQGARTAAAQVQRVADITGAGVAKALLGKDVLSDDLPYVTGSIGLLGTRPSYELMQFLPKYGAARAVQVDIDGSAIGMRYPTELNIVADAASALDALIPLLKEKHDRSWRTTVENDVSDWWETLERQSMLSAKPANPMRIVWELSQRLPHNAIVTADSGSSTNWYARCLRFTDGVRVSVSGTLATMGCAVPYAIGAKFAHPDRPAIALVGDGGMQMNAMAELLTIRRFSGQWKDPRLIVCHSTTTISTRSPGNCARWAVRPNSNPRNHFPYVSYVEVANAMGISGIAIDRDDGIGPAWDRALAAEGPTVLDIRCDPEMPPIPPHATYEQIKELTTAILEGDPEALHLMNQGATTNAQEFIPHRR
jgi:pyruvate dehydrogenase (quinone)